MCTIVRRIAITAPAYDNTDHDDLTRWIATNHVALEREWRSCECAWDFLEFTRAEHGAQFREVAA